MRGRGHRAEILSRLGTKNGSSPSFAHSERIGMRQSQVDKLYAGLKDLSEERRGKLDERFRLFQLNREVDDLEQWIAEREVVAGSHELGQDYEHVTVRTVQPIIRLIRIKTEILQIFYLFFYFFQVCISKCLFSSFLEAASFLLPQSRNFHFIKIILFLSCFRINK